MNPYRLRVLDLLLEALEGVRLPHSPSCLDFGAGDGWFAKQMRLALIGSHIDAVDVQQRDHCESEVEIIDHDALKEFPSKAYDLVYAIDVLHHCDDPESILKNLARVSSRYVLIKDHVAFNRLDVFTLGVLDEIGNRRFGIASNYHYQQRWKWHSILLSSGWEVASKIYPAACHTGLLGKITNRLQYVALYRASGLSEDDSAL